jgi:hypothetical protein
MVSGSVTIAAVIVTHRVVARLPGRGSPLPLEGNPPRAFLPSLSRLKETYAHCDKFLTIAQHRVFFHKISVYRS